MTQKGVSLQTHIEVTRHYATKYSMASKKLKGQLLDTVRRITGWNWDTPKLYTPMRYILVDGLLRFLAFPVGSKVKYQRVRRLLRPEARVSREPSRQVLSLQEQ